jgi:hypothetical protein
MVEWPENVGMKDFVPKAHLKFEIKDGAHRITVI